MKRFFQYFSLIVMLCLWGTGSMYAGDTYYYGNHTAKCTGAGKGKVYVCRGSESPQYDYQEESTVPAFTASGLQSVHFYAKPDPGNDFVGWYEEADCTNFSSEENPYKYNYIVGKESADKAVDVTLFAKFVTVPLLTLGNNTNLTLPNGSTSYSLTVEQAGHYKFTPSQGIGITCKDNNQNISACNNIAYLDEDTYVIKLENSGEEALTVDLNIAAYNLPTLTTEGTTIESLNAGTSWEYVYQFTAPADGGYYISTNKEGASVSVYGSSPYTNPSPVRVDNQGHVYCQQGQTYYVQLNNSGSSPIEQVQVSVGVYTIFTYTATADQGYSFFDNFSNIGTVSYEKWTDASTPVTVTVDGIVKEIPERFFYASQLTSITLPSSVESIGNLAFSSSDNLAKVEFSSIPLVAEGAFGVGSNIEYTLALTDDSYVYTGATNSFPAVTSATYTRTMPTDEEGNPRRWGSAVLPFTVVTADQTGVKPYCFSGVSSLGNEDATLTVEVMESVGAGHPFLFCNTAGNASVTFANVAQEGQTINISTNIVQGDTDTFSDEDCSTIDIYMFGTYGEEQTSSSDENIYFIAQDKFWWAEESIAISSFRAWFEILITENDGDPEGGDDPVDAPARSFTIEVGDDVAESISAVKSEELGVRSGYDLFGRQVGAGQKGLQIRDGRVMFF